ncbi:MAG: hypothetical protein K2X11_04440, partial [Acetobacteraceae bacterium]|nr:hypothetical protein [Acetobacteraceae bacterium]
MRHLKWDSPAERQRTANAARQAALARFAQQPRPDDPEMVARMAERVAIAEARAARQAERDAAR